MHVHAGTPRTGDMQPDESGRIVDVEPSLAQVLVLVRDRAALGIGRVRLHLGRVGGVDRRDRWV